MGHLLISCGMVCPAVKRSVMKWISGQLCAGPPLGGLLQLSPSSPPPTTPTPRLSRICREGGSVVKKVKSLKQNVPPVYPPS